MGITYRVYLDDNYHYRIYTCSNCQNHLTTNNLLISKDFHGLRGKAYLFDKVVNIKVSSETQERVMTTGKHCISYISCVGCGENLGWKYIKAYSEEQKYKEGKFILEKCALQLLNTSSREY